MGGLFGFISDALFGKQKVPEADWEELAKLQKLGIEGNRYSTYGPFTNQVWDENKENMTMEVTPELDQGMANLLARVNAGTERPERERFTDLMAAYESGQPLRPGRVRREHPVRGRDHDRPVYRGPGRPEPMDQEKHDRQKFERYS